MSDANKTTEEFSRATTSMEQPEYWLARMRTIVDLETRGSFSIREAYKQLKQTVTELNNHERRKEQFNRQLAWRAAEQKPKIVVPNEAVPPLVPIPG